MRIKRVATWVSRTRLEFVPVYPGRLGPRATKWLQCVNGLGIQCFVFTSYTKWQRAILERTRRAVKAAGPWPQADCNERSRVV